MCDVFDVANYFLKRQDPDAGDLMSNLKLQKLVYYAQGFHLAILDVLLFNERIEAWEHGPVCVELYHKYKAYASGSIPIPYEENAYDVFSDKSREVLDMVHTYYGQFSAWKLRNLTHMDTPWVVAYNNGRGEITHESLKSYFKTQLVDDDEKT